MTTPKITIITCVLNSEKYLAECLASVNDQSYKNIEHIFIDGLSSDGTLEIIRKFCPAALIFSGRDGSIYEALNKGFELATGDIVGILHSDDVFADNQALERVAAAFNDNKDLDFYCSRMLVCDEKLNNIFAALGAPPHKQTFGEAFYSSNYYAHPTYYCRRSVIKKVGIFDIRHKIAADIDWLIRLERLNLKWYFDKKPLIKFRSSKNSLTSRKYFSALKEEFIIRLKYEHLSIFLVIIYSYHFFRRFIRCLIAKVHLNFLIALFRKILIKLS